MKFIALVSGGKDSILSLMACIAMGHEPVAIAHLYPILPVPSTSSGTSNQKKGSNEKRNDGSGNDDETRNGEEEGSALQEIDSPSFQTVGHQIVSKIAQCLNLPYRGQGIYQGQCVVDSLNYSPPSTENEEEKLVENIKQKEKNKNEEEIETLFQLLHDIQKEFLPEGGGGVSSGAILSNYQRFRVENCCSRLGLTSLAYLWQYPAEKVLQLLTTYEVDAILIKVATMGLSPKKHLGESFFVMKKKEQEGEEGGTKNLIEYLLQIQEKYQVHAAGEGGEFETAVLDCPLFQHGYKLKLTPPPDTSTVVPPPTRTFSGLPIHIVDDNPIAPSGYLLFDVALVEKSTEETKHSREVMERFREREFSCSSILLSHPSITTPCSSSILSETEEINHEEWMKEFSMDIQRQIFQKKKALQSCDSDVENEKISPQSSERRQQVGGVEPSIVSPTAMNNDNSSSSLLHNNKYVNNVIVVEQEEKKSYDAKVEQQISSLSSATTSNSDVPRIRSEDTMMNAAGVSCFLNLSPPSNSTAQTPQEQLFSVFNLMVNLLEQDKRRMGRFRKEIAGEKEEELRHQNDDVCDSILHIILSVPNLASQWGEVNAAYTEFFTSRQKQTMKKQKQKVPPPPPASRACIEDNTKASISIDVFYNNDFDKWKRNATNTLHVQSFSSWATACIGPYAQAVKTKKIGDDNNGRTEEETVTEILFVSGQIGLVPETRQLIRTQPSTSFSSSCGGELKKAQFIAEFIQAVRNTLPILKVMQSGGNNPYQRRHRNEQTIDNDGVVVAAFDWQEFGPPLKPQSTISASCGEAAEFLFVTVFIRHDVEKSWLSEFWVPMIGVEFNEKFHRVVSVSALPAGACVEILVQHIKEY